jgi:hypothetical protein
MGRGRLLRAVAVAALALPTGTVIADPFRRTADACDLLRLRADQIADGYCDMLLR